MKWIEPDWPAPAHVHAATTLRSGGVSGGPFFSLNPAAHVGDRNEDVMQNRERIRTALGLPSEPVWLSQVHGTRVVRAEPGMQPVEADGSYSDKPGVVCAVLTADCLPLLLTDEEGRRIAAVHAGWRGLAAGVVEAALDVMGGEPILAWLGPAIGPERFEVGDDVRQVFLRRSAEFASAFKQTADDKWLADMYRLARITLSLRDVGRVFGGNWCTVGDAERFYSYRRDGETGRMATLIWRD